jgi:hypothetical protein
MKKVISGRICGGMTKQAGFFSYAQIFAKKRHI